MARLTRASLKNPALTPFELRGRLFPVLVCVLLGCTPLISPYDHTAYQNATSLKAEALVLAEKAVEPYNQHEARIEALLLAVDKAYEYSKGLPNNSIAAKQWDIIRNPSGNLLGGLIRVWKDEKKVSKAYATEKREQLARAFDYVICLEMNKKEAAVCSAKAGGQ